MTITDALNSQTATIVGAINDLQTEDVDEIITTLNTNASNTIAALDQGFAKLHSDLAKANETSNLILAAINHQTDVMQNIGRNKESRLFVSALRIGYYTLVPLTDLFGLLKESNLGGRTIWEYLTTLTDSNGNATGDVQLALTAQWAGFKFKAGYPHSLNGHLVFDTDVASTADTKRNQLLFLIQKGKPFLFDLKYTIAAVEEAIDPSFNVDVNLFCTVQAY